MVLAAALLLLAGVALFVLGVTTAVTTWYWACVAACGLAAVLLVVARLQAPAPRHSAPRTEESGPDRPAAATSAAGGGAAGEDPAADDGAARPGEETPERTPPTADPARPVTRPRSGRPGGDAAGRDATDPPEEDEEFTDLLRVVDLTDEVLVVDEHPRYHLATCSWLGGRETIPLPVREARTDGFTPCAVCGPDAHLAGVERARKAARRT